MIWYFTYGQSESQPFEGGWTEVIADMRSQAVNMFRMFHADRLEGIVNCADIYSEDEFRKTDMFVHGNYNERCIEVIRVKREKNTKVQTITQEYTTAFLCHQFRRWLDISQNHLAKLCGVSSTTLWKAENGMKISARNEKQIRKVVDHNNGL